MVAPSSSPKRTATGAGSNSSSSAAAARRRAVQLLAASGSKLDAAKASAGLSTPLPPPPSDLKVQPLERALPAGAFARYTMRDDQGRGVCWRVSGQSAEEFAAAHLGKRADDVLFQSRRVAVVFPIGERYAVRRVCNIRGAVTVARLLRAVEETAVRAVTLHLSGAVDEDRMRVMPSRPLAKVTAGDVRRFLRRCDVCHLMCARVGANRVYVRFAKE